MKINEVIRQVDDRYSKKGKNLGTVDSKSAAEKHEREVQYFEHVNEESSDIQIHPTVRKWIDDSEPGRSTGHFDLNTGYNSTPTKFAQAVLQLQGYNKLLKSKDQVGRTVIQSPDKRITFYFRNGKDMAMLVDREYVSPEQSKEIQVGINEDWEQDPGYDYENPLPHSNDAWIWDVMEEIEDEYRERYANGESLRPKDIADKYGKLMSVPLNKIITTEKWLKKEQIEAIMNNNATSSSAMPIFYYEDGKYVTGDGNHRIVAAYLNKEQAIKGRVLSLEFLDED